MKQSSHIPSRWMSRAHPPPAPDCRSSPTERTSIPLEVDEMHDDSLLPYLPRAPPDCVPGQAAKSTSPRTGPSPEAPNSATRKQLNKLGSIVSNPGGIVLTAQRLKERIKAKAGGRHEIAGIPYAVVAGIHDWPDEEEILAALSAKPAPRDETTAACSAPTARCQMAVTYACPQSSP